MSKKIFPFPQVWKYVIKPSKYSNFTEPKVVIALLYRNRCEYYEEGSSKKLVSGPDFNPYREAELLKDSGFRLIRDQGDKE